MGRGGLEACRGGRPEQVAVLPLLLVLLGLAILTGRLLGRMYRRPDSDLDEFRQSLGSLRHTVNRRL